MSTANIFDLADVWNDAATTFTAIKMNVTDTASAAASNLIDLQVGGVSRFSISKSGLLRGSVNYVASGESESNDPFSITSVTAVGGTRTFSIDKFGALNLGVNQVIKFGGSIIINGAGESWLGNAVGGRCFAAGNAYADLARNEIRLGGTNRTNIFVEAADTLAQRQGTNPQAFNLYNTFTNATNYERARMGWAGNAFQIRPEADGTGTERVLHISGLPTSNPGPGILWNDGGDVKVGT
jgi:hypothetical protein